MEPGGVCACAGPRVVNVNVGIQRGVLRVPAAAHRVLAKRLAEFNGPIHALAMSHHTFSRNTRSQLRDASDALHELMTPADPPKRPIIAGGLEPNRVE